MVEEEDRETILIPEKRTRHDSNSTDVDPSFEVEPLSSDPAVRRDSFSPCGSGYRDRHKSGPSTSPLPPSHPQTSPCRPHHTNIRPQHQRLLLHSYVSGLLSAGPLSAPLDRGICRSLPPSDNLRQIHLVTRAWPVRSGLQELETPETWSDLQPAECHQTLERPPCLAHSVFSEPDV